MVGYDGYRRFYKVVEQITFIDLFSGVGGFTRGMELAGHKCVGHCEIDRYAEASYRSMHCITEEQREYLKTLPLKERQKEILKEEYLNGEWYADDVSNIDSGNIPKSDCWCFGFPCQDISIAGKQKGFRGNRSSLFFSVMGLLKEMPERNKPRLLFVENVRNLLSINGGFDFARVLVEMARGGYCAEWRVLNSKDYGVPQNRERVFIVGYSRKPSGRTIFPIKENNGEATRLQGQPDIRTTNTRAGERETYNRGKADLNIIANTLTAGDRNQNGTYLIDGGGVLKVNGYHKECTGLKAKPKNRNCE